MSFRDFITNRWYRKRIYASFERYQNIKPPDNPSPRYIDKLVKRLLSHRTAWDARKELEMIGAAAVPLLAAAVARDPRFLSMERERPVIPAPFELVLELLVPHGPEHVLAAAMPLVSHESADVRKTVALHVASLGRHETLPVLAKFLTDVDGYVRAYVQMGIDRALKAGRVGDVFRRGAYDLLLGQCDQKWSGGAGQEAAKTVVALDPARAAVDLADPRLLSPANPVVHKLLTACYYAGVLLPEAPVRALLEHSMARARGERCYPNEYVAGAALQCLALRLGEDARPTLKAALEHEQGQIRRCAAEAIVGLAGLDNPFGVACDQIDKAGFESLSHPQQVVYLAHTFDYEVCNGGITQFFGNSSGDHVVETLEALRELGVPEAERLLAEALRLIGPLARDPDRETRLIAFQDRFDALQRQLEPLESAFYKTEGRLTQANLLYAARHADHFRKRAATPT